MRSPLRLPLAMMMATIALALATGTAAAAPPANDNFADAQTLSGDRGSTYFDLSESTTEASEPLASGAIARTIWFSYTPSTTGIVKFSTCNNDAGLAITGANLTAFTGASLGALTSAADSSGNCPVDQVNATIALLPVTAGTTYSLQLGAAADTEILGGALVYDFNTAVPANDNFADAAEITGALPQTVIADNGFATSEADEPGLDLWGPSNSLWYRWTADFSGVLSVDTCSTTWSGENAVDSRVHIFTEDGAPAELLGLTQFGVADDGCAQPNSQLSHAYVSVASGTEYWLRLANYSDAFGYDYRLRLRQIVDPETTADPFIYTSNDPPQVGDSLMLGEYEWAADPGITSYDYQWLRCDADGNNCAVIDGATTVPYLVGSVDLGHRLRARITAHNGVTSTAATSAATAVVVNPPPPPTPPVDPDPPVDPPAPTSPLTLTVKAALGKLKPRKGVVTIKGAVVTCAASATGPCTGSVTFTYKVAGKAKKFTTAKLSVAPGKSSAVTFKVSKSKLKALKKAKKLKGTISVTATAPGFASTTATGSATLKP